MSELKIDLSNIRFAVFKQVFSDVEATLKHLDVDFYVIGALARDMIFSIDAIPTRTTADVDLAVYINGNEDDYKAVVDHLITNYNFVQSSMNAFTVISNDGHTLDLLPFGEIEVEDGISITGEGLTSIKVNGFREVFEDGLIKIEADGDKAFSVASLSSIILLKLIAFNDRPEMRGNDPGDVASIIKNYFALNDDDIFENHNDLFVDNEDDDEFQLEYVSAQVIGRSINKIVAQNHKLFERIKSIVKEHIEAEEKSSFVLAMVGDYCNNVELAVTWLKFVLKGIKE